MTSIIGYSMIATRCCRGIYSTPKYRSINLSAFAVWTDGFKEGALFSVGGGLRKCKCGAFYLLKDAISLGIDADPTTTKTILLDAADLPVAIRSTTNKELELEARREYWREMNHPYRVQYRLHRELEEKELQKKWLNEWMFTYKNRPFKERLLNRLLLKKIQPPEVHKKKFTVPPFSPSIEQFENMVQILELNKNNNLKDNADTTLESAEILRELGRFEEAQNMLEDYDPNNNALAAKVMKMMLDSRTNAPVRFRY